MRLTDEQVERAQRADLVDAAGEAAAAEHEGGLRGPGAGAAARPATLRRCRRAAALWRDVSRLTTLPMAPHCTSPFGRSDRDFRSGVLL